MEKYLAGYFDGEGCIHIHVKTFALHCSVASTKLDALEIFYELFHGNVRILKRKLKKNHRIIYHWVVTSSQAEMFLERILPYLILKKKEAELALEFREKCFAPRNEDHRRYTIKKLTKFDIERREEYRLRMRKLK